MRSMLGPLFSRLSVAIYAITQNIMILTKQSLKLCSVILAKYNLVRLIKTSLDSNYAESDSPWRPSDFVYGILSDVLAQTFS